MTRTTSTIPEAHTMWPFTKRQRTSTAPAAPAEPQEPSSRPEPTVLAPPIPARARPEAAPRASASTSDLDASFWTDSPASPFHPGYIDFAPPLRHPSMPSKATYAGLVLPAPVDADLDELEQGVHAILNDLVGPTGRYRLVPRAPGDDDGDEIFTRLIVDHTVAHISERISDTIDAQQRQVEPPTAPVIAIDRARSRRA